MQLDDVLARLREICLALPETTEGVAWRHPVFRVGGTMFCGYERVAGTMTVGVKLEVPHAELLERQARVVQAQKFGRYRWVSIDASSIDDWRWLSGLITESYHLSATASALAKLDRKVEVD